MWDRARLESLYKRYKIQSYGVPFERFIVDVNSVNVQGTDGNKPNIETLVRTLVSTYKANTKPK